MNRKKYSILVFNRHYLPGFKAGGPIRTISNTVDRLGCEFDFRIVTLDRDFGDLHSYKDLGSEEWHKVGQASVRYLRPDSVTLIKLSQIINGLDPSVLYLNSFFDSIFTQRVLLLRKLGLIPRYPIILAPRGEFSEGALEIKKIKKLTYILLARLTGLYKGLTWLASSKIEREDIKRLFPKVKDKGIHVAINLPPDTKQKTYYRDCEKVPGTVKIVFLSRLSPKKNLDFALRVLKNVSAKVEFTIFGPKEDSDYWNECQNLIDGLPSNIQVTWEGEVTPDIIHESLSQHHLFFFPTRGENYGHVIQEALSSGLPVLISDQTPWQDLEEAGVGWSIPLSSPGKFAGLIEEVAHWDNNKILSVSEAALNYAIDKAGDHSALDANRQLFLRQL